ncbi:tetratricopeptide repeat protein [Methanofollis fontis]|uniref:Uncharacterized protein n=1 Tax=Methanofollis fontis TaxID=2052832 RepID=A0A483CNV7_9EURY|nr:tetratricopeptide repeat protein [Methanofollis fontis]TAJ44690.1 hypothetical protein CUJ86_05150 [Methanofollis fontis]
MDRRLIAALLLIIIATAPGCLGSAGGSPGYDQNTSLQQGYAQYCEAIECLDAEIERNPENASAWFFKGMWLNNWFNQYEGALECYDAALALDPGDADVLFAKGISLWNLERFDEADDCFARACRIDPALAVFVPRHGDPGNRSESVAVAAGG